MKRVLCDECRENSECRECFDLDNPNPKKIDGGASDWSRYDFLACVLHDWLGVCWGCTSGFEYDSMFCFHESLNKRSLTDIGKKYKKIEDCLKIGYGLEGHELYEQIVKTAVGRKKINMIRDLLHDDVESYFSSSIDGCFDDRLDTYSPVQMKLTGIDD